MSGAIADVSVRRIRGTAACMRDTVGVIFDLEEVHARRG
jgi:hypothetical protein